MLRIGIIAMKLLHFDLNKFSIVIIVLYYKIQLLYKQVFTRIPQMCKTTQYVTPNKKKVKNIILLQDVTKLTQKPKE